MPRSFLGIQLRMCTLLQEKAAPVGNKKAPPRFNASSPVASNAFSSTYRKAATASMCSHSSVDMCLCAHRRILDTLRPTGLQRQFLLTYCETHTCAKTCVCADAICISLRELPPQRSSLQSEITDRYSTCDGARAAGVDLTQGPD